MKSRLLILLFLLTFSSFGYTNTIDSLLVTLDEAILRGPEYQQIRKTRIDGLISLVNEPQMGDTEKYLVYSKIYNEYMKYQFDSAIYYLEVKTNLAKKLNLKDQLSESLIQQLNLLASSGMYQEAFEVNAKIKRTEIPASLLNYYYSSLSFLYSNMLSYINIPSKKPEYTRLRDIYRDSCMLILNHDSKPYLTELEKAYFINGEFEKSCDLALKLESTTSPSDLDYAYYAYRVAISMRGLGKQTEEKEYLIKSAIADIRNGIKDNASLTMLAMMLYGENKIEKAYDYIHFSLSDAAFFNAPLRIIEMSNVIPVINEAYNKKLERQKGTLQRYSLLISFLTVFLIASLFFIFRQFKNLAKVRTDIQTANNKLNELNEELSKANDQLKGLNNELVESNHIKEQYIGHFLNRCSNYIEKLENYQKFVNKKVAARKFTELFEQTKSNQLIEDELAEFYETFDKTFLILFPNFVEQLNELFNEDERIILKKDELLNTELRIFALIKLGINDSSKIASLLRYSVNTIYNYRVKIKNKSLIPREEFEERVKNIGTFNSNQ